jgi:hypothetical protein
MNRIYSALLLWIVCMQSGCTFLDDAAPVPMFLNLSAPKVIGSQGMETHNITEAWVFQDNEIIGVFPIPAKVPIVSTRANAEIKILAGVKDNGMVDFPVLYPFYKEIIQTVVFTPGTELSIPLEFTYIANKKLPIDEGFEGTNIFTLDDDQNLESKLQLSNVNPSVGQSCGMVNLDGVANYIGVISSTEIKASEVSRGASYLELDYRGEGEIAVGVTKVVGNKFKNDFVLFIPGKEKWNRIYINLTQALQSKDYDSYRIVIGFRKNIQNPTAEMYVDNIKHVHF